MIDSLSPKTKEIVGDYLSLPLPIKVKCPYHNNRKTKTTAGLRVLIGKSYPSEIVDEVTLIALREKVDLKNLNKETTTKFLVDHNIGVDCSGFAYWVLNTESKARGLGSLSKNILINKNKNILRRLIGKLRPAENTGVRTLSIPENSSAIKIDESRPADFIVMIGEDNDGRADDHILVITEVTKSDKELSIKYAHSINWAEDGVYNTGTSEGVIKIKLDSLASSIWTERDLSGENNPTFIRSKRARILEIRRLNIFK